MRPSKRMSDEIDLTGFSDDSEPSPTASESFKRHKADDGRSSSPSLYAAPRSSRRRPLPDAEIRVTRAMHRKNLSVLSTPPASLSSIP